MRPDRLDQPDCFASKGGKRHLFYICSSFRATHPLRTAMGCASSKRSDDVIHPQKETPYNPAATKPVENAPWGPSAPSAPPMMSAPVYPPIPVYPPPHGEQVLYPAIPSGGGDGGRYVDPNALPSAYEAALMHAAVAGTSSVRRIMLVDPINAVGWLGEPRTRTGVADYTYKREITHTGDLIDAPTGDRIGKIHDVTPHRADPQTGLRLSGPNVFGKYETVDGPEVTLGSFELDARKLTVSGTAASVAVRLVYTGACVHDAHVFHMGNGWADHFTIAHLDGYLKFSLSPNNASGAWENRVECSSGIRDKDFEPGKMYTIVAVCTEEGRMRLYVDGELRGEGDGLAALPEFETSRTRKEAWCGRFMRPDTSMPVRAGILSVEAFDGALDDATVRAEYSVREVYKNVG